MIPSILNVIPRAVPLLLGTSCYQVFPLRLADIADLQAFINAHHPNPFDEAGGAIGRGYGERSEAWFKLFARTFDAQEEWPRTPGTPEADVLLNGHNGRAFLIGLVLREKHPELTVADFDRIADEISVDDWGRLQRVAWGDDPLAAMVAIIDGSTEEEAEPIDWPRLWHEYSAETGRNAPPFDQLTISQLRVWLCRGKSFDGRVSADEVSMAHYEEIARRRREFWNRVIGTDLRPFPDEPAA